MKLACPDFAFPLLSFEKTIALISMLEFEGIDVGLIEGEPHLQPSQIFANIATSARRLARQVADAGLILADIFAHPLPGFAALAPNHPDAKVRRQSRRTFLHLVEFAARVGSPHLTMVPGIAWKGQRSRDTMQRTADELSWRSEQARLSGIVFAVEPHIGSIIDTPARAMELLRLAPELTLTVDYAHFTVAGATDDEIEPLLAHASHIHARGGCRGKVQASMAENTIDFNRMAAVLRRRKYKGFVEVEYVWSEWQRCNEVDNISETIQLRDLLSRSNRMAKRAKVDQKFKVGKPAN